MSDNKFWLLFWSVAATTIVSVVGLCVFSMYTTDLGILELTKNGASPIEARCALRGEGQNSTLCNIYQLTR